jgi:GTP-binding protein
VKVFDASFWAAAEPGRSLPPALAPEIAFGGRSNVGKSSLLGALASRTKLVRVSRTPGRTRSIVVFQLRAEAGAFGFADLPGYGWAEVSQEIRASWGPLVEGYLAGREGLRGLVVLVDLRRGIEPDDAQLLDYAKANAIPALVVATKADKLPKSKRKPALSAIVRASGRRAVSTSAVTGEGLGDVWRWIAETAYPSRPADRAARARRST